MILIHFRKIVSCMVGWLNVIRTRMFVVYIPLNTRNHALTHTFFKASEEYTFVSER